MPSPFPGMDPYLERPDWFPCLHDGLIFCALESLQSSLPQEYYAQSSQRVWLEYSRRYVEPDVRVVRSSRTRRRDRQGGVAIAEVETNNPVVVRVETIEHGPFKESYVEVRRREGKKVRIVTSIEVLSPSNKSPGNPGRELYLSKQREILGADTHLVEIDLLRGGAHTSAVPHDLAEQKAGPFDYHVSTHRFDRPQDFLVHPIRLDERLPRIGIPLLDRDPDVHLDLQTMFDRAYDAGPYHREVEYGKDRITPRLRADQAKWVAGLIKSKATRGAK
jgi:Protein of unknown function (DUF4058)